MITEAIIENFKCFKKLTLPDLGRITIIGGKNNVGKTALLEAFFLFFDRAALNMILKQYGWRGVVNVKATPEGMWKPIFREFDFKKRILNSVWIDKKKETIEYKFNPNFMLEELPPNEALHVSDISVRTDIKPIPSFSLDFKYVDSSQREYVSHLMISPKGAPGIKHDSLPQIRKVYFLPARGHASSKEISDRFSKLSKIGRENEALKFLNIIEPRLKSLKIITEGPEPIIYGDIGLPEMIPIPFIGGGMSRLLEIFLAMTEGEGNTIFIDEIENGIHRLIMSKIWEAICDIVEDYNCQVIATTHSYECLEAVHKGLANRPDDLRYIRLDREGNDIKAKTSNYEMLGTAIAHNMEIR